MKPGVDVKHINPFLQSCLSVFNTVAQIKLSIGKPTVADIKFPATTLLIEIGLTGTLKGQMLLAMTVEKAKNTASLMMGGMPVGELDELSCSALSELGNMIMGNAATIFSTQDMAIDITPPVVVIGTELKIRTEVQALKIPMLIDGVETFSLYVCVANE